MYANFSYVQHYYLSSTHGSVDAELNGVAGEEGGLLLTFVEENVAKGDVFNLERVIASWWDRNKLKHH